MELWKEIEKIYNEQKNKTHGLEVEILNNIPKESSIDLETNRWYRVDNVVCLYFDMENSSRLANNKGKNAIAYELFTGGAIKIMNYEKWKSHYLDVKGDGGFALWKDDHASVKAILAAVTFKTYIMKYFGEENNFSFKVKIGITKGNVLVKKIGERNRKGKTYNWVVWAGRPVNIAAKLSDIARGNTILVTNNVYADISTFDKKHLIYSCGCGTNGTPELLWKKIDDMQEFGILWKLDSYWCDLHGEEYINAVLEKIYE